MSRFAGPVHYVLTLVLTALLFLFGLSGFPLGCTAAMFSEGLDEPWTSSLNAVIVLGAAFSVVSLVAAIGITRDRPWGQRLGIGVLAGLVVGTTLWGMPGGFLCSVVAAVGFAAVAMVRPAIVRPPRH